MRLAVLCSSCRTRQCEHQAAVIDPIHTAGGGVRDHTQIGLLACQVIEGYCHPADWSSIRNRKFGFELTLQKRPTSPRYKYT